MSATAASSGISASSAGQAPLTAEVRPSADVLFLRLEGPLMAWGDNSHWSIRDSRREPTKSGVIGLLACALGLGKDEESDARISELSRHLELGVRADRAGDLLRDYHTVYGGVLDSRGGIKRSPSSGAIETVVSERSYLADAAFLAALAGPTNLLDELAAALLTPKWPPYLGRKSCPPTAPIYPALPRHPSRGRYSSLVTALASFPYLGRDTMPEHARVVVELGSGERPPRDLPFQQRNDQPLSFLNRRFARRAVYEDWVKLTPEEQVTATSGDWAEG